MPRWCIFCSNRTGALLVAGAQLVLALCGIVLAVVVVTSSMSSAIAGLQIHLKILLPDDDAAQQNSNATTTASTLDNVVVVTSTLIPFGTTRASDNMSSIAVNTTLARISTVIVNSTESNSTNMSATQIVVNKTIETISIATTAPPTTTQTSAQVDKNSEVDITEAKEWMGVFSRNVEAASKAALYSLSVLDIISPVCLIVGINKNIILLVIIWTIVNIAEAIGAALVLCFFIVLVSLDWRWLAAELDRQQQSGSSTVAFNNDLRRNLNEIVSLIYTIGIILLVAIIIYIMVKIYFVLVVWSARNEVARQANDASSMSGGFAFHGRVAPTATMMTTTSSSVKYMRNGPNNSDVAQIRMAPVAGSRMKLPLVMEKIPIPTAPSPPLHEYNR